MSKKAVFLDRDGTLIEDKGYMRNCDEIKLLTGVIEALSTLKKSGFELIIISNQSGIGRGLITKAEVEEINKYLTNLLISQGISLTAIYYCPHTPDDKCFCRKPNPGMVLLALNQYNINPKESFFVGDKHTDVETAINAGVNPVLISTNSKLEKNNHPIVVVDSLLTWVKSIEQGDFPWMI
jgi:D-glycero-D-manno-heptose 1,7-bisphosphate phosphatase